MPKLNFTIAMPCRNDIKFANTAIEAMLKYCNYNIVIIDDCSDKPDDEYLKNSRITVIKNTEKKVVVQLFNQAIKVVPTEYVILTCDKIRACKQDFIRIEDRLNSGFACVATAMFGFFGFSKELTTRIGFFDEGFKSTNYEDTDWMNKLFINNLSLYISGETNRILSKSRWKKDLINKKYYDSKWKEEPERLTQLKNDENEEDKNIYKNTFTAKKYLPWKKSILKTKSVFGCYDKKIAVKGF